MPRLLLALFFMVLFAASFAMLIRRASLAFGAMITFFFTGWFLQTRLGTYSLLTPSGAFTFAYYESVGNLAGIPIPGREIFLLYLVAALVAFFASLFYASRRGELE